MKLQTRTELRVVDIINLSSSAETLLRERVLAMRAAGIDNRIICMDGPHVAGLRAAGIPVFVAPLPRGFDPVRSMASLWSIARYLGRERIDLVHTHCSVPGFLGRLASWIARVPIIVHTVHGFHFHERSSALARVLFVGLERFAGTCTDTLLIQNRDDLVQAHQHRIVPRERIQLIGNGVSMERFHPAAQLDRPTPTLICVARMEAVKNHRMLLEAVRILARRGVAFRLRLVGNGVLREELRRLAVDWGIEERIDWLGYRDDIPELLAQSEVALLTSVKEGIPRAALEAMASGLPVVATRVTGTREAVRDGETGFLVPLGDAAALAGRIEQLLRDPELRWRMGLRGREVAMQEFDEAAIVVSLQRTYVTRLARRGLPVPQRLAATVKS